MYVGIYIKNKLKLGRKPRGRMSCRICVRNVESRSELVGAIAYGLRDDRSGKRV